MPIQSQNQFNGNNSSFVNKVCFDPELAVIKGFYTDEISAYRAKRIWNETLIENFFLEEKIDFSCRIKVDPDTAAYNLICGFNTPCGRYAFWRITNYQSPETQYIMETAHIPFCEAREEELLSAAELVTLIEEQFKREDLENSSKIVFDSKQFANKLVQQIEKQEKENLNIKFARKFSNLLRRAYSSIFSLRS